MKYSAGLIPVDALILKHMTAEGTELAEFIPLGPSVKALSKRIEGITSSQIGGRVRILEREGYCVAIPLLPASQGRGWQRTPKGDAFLAEVESRGVMAAILDANKTINDEPGTRGRGLHEVVRETKEHVEDGSAIEADPMNAQRRGE